MTAVFRSCLPRFYSNTNQSISNEYLSNKTMDSLSIQSDPQLDLLSSSPKPISHLKTTNTKITKKRGPRYSRINKKPQPLLTRLVSTIFGDHGFSTVNNKKQQTMRTSKKSLLPSKSTIKKQFKENEQTLRSLVTLLTQIESNDKLTTSTNIISNKNLSIENEQARNNNRMDDTSSSHSNDSHHHQSKRHTKKHINNKKRQSENDTLCSSSIDHQQQTQLYPTKITIGTSTQFNDTITSELSWLDIMREDQITINAWARIRRRLKPNQQKDILRALMIICANLFEVPLENKHS